MRGKESFEEHGFVIGGITPACAGKSRATAAQQRAGRDHPRVCGEKLIASKRETLCTGSPPRVRGKAFIAEIRTRAVRITPACAGKRTDIARAARPVWDHPRVCGEKIQCPLSTRRCPGSPPRVRGKANFHLFLLFGLRITPACAGKRLCLSLSFAPLWDHPRVCGEKEVKRDPLLIPMGSPPRVRGKAGPQQLQCCFLRITPACAGKRLKRSHSIGHFSCILCLFHSVLHRASVSGGSRAGPCAPPCLPAQNAVPV